MRTAGGTQEWPEGSLAAGKLLLLARRAEGEEGMTAQQECIGIQQQAEIGTLLAMMDKIRSGGPGGWAMTEQREDGPPVPLRLMAYSSWCRSRPCRGRLVV